jgi:hypothetical protein
LLAFAVAWASSGCSSDGDGRGDDGAGPNAGASGTGPQSGRAGNASGNSGSGASPGGASGSGGGPSGGSGSGSGRDAGAGGSGAGSTPSNEPPPGPVAVDQTDGRWRTALDPATGRFSFVTPDGAQAVLRGISMTGIETGTRETAAGAGFWLFSANQAPEADNAKTVLRNVVRTLVDGWKSDVVRIPICGSAWTQNYVVHDWANARVATYREWIDIAVQEARAAGAVVIIDNHLWAVARMGNGTDVDRGTFTSNGVTHAYEEYEDGCTGINMVGGKDSCAPKDWYVDDPNVWQCAIANADGVTIHNAYKNQDNIASMWADIAARYADDSGVWFELFNEPYSRKAAQPFPSDGVNDEEADYPWDLWSEFMHTQIQAIRDQAQAPNIVIVNGLDWGYDFGPEHGPIARPATFLPWLSTYANIAYAFHPYQHGSCCGEIGASGTDLSATDPYQSGYCSYYADGTEWGQPSGAALPGGKTCTNRGYASTQDKKMPPCTWVPTAWNPATDAAGLCAGDRVSCGAKSQAECEAMDVNSPAAGGWSKHVLPMAKYGPLIATEYGSFDCSSPFVTRLLGYADQLGISYTAWALWPQNSGGPAGLGSCGYPALIAPAADPGDFRACLDAGACDALMQPLPWAGKATYDDLASP